MTRKVSRRGLIGAGAASSAGLLAGQAAGAIGGAGMPWLPDDAAFPETAKASRSWRWFRGAEGAFVEAASARLIPADALGGGAIEAGVPQFIDAQLAGAFGAARGWYMQGPWAPGLPTQGWQSRFTPAQFYRAAIADIGDDIGRADHGARFEKLAAADQDAYLKRLESGQAKLRQVDAKAFFDLFQQNVLEGFFCDPIHGGNRGMIGWKLIGFPGARYDKRSWALAWGKPYALPPVGIAGRPDWERG